MTIEIIYIHGLNANGTTMLPFKYYIGQGHVLTYQTNGKTIDEMVSEVDGKILDIVKTKQTQLILIGWSMGGLIANRLHVKGWNVLMGIYIASPLNGASIFKYIPTMCDIHDYLADKTQEVEPPHDYHTISLGWLVSNFDGCVFKTDTLIHPDNHEHISFTDHRFSVLDLRVLSAVNRKIIDCFRKQCTMK